MHQSCYISMSSSDKLEKARRCKNKESAQCSSQTSSSEMKAHKSMCDDKTEAWRSLKRHPVLIEDGDLRDRLTRLIESTSDPFANDVMYHHACWRKYVNHTHFNPDDAMHLQNVSLSEARSLFFRHVDSIIFTEREIRSLQSLLAEYKRIVGDYGYEVGDVKSSYVKGLLINEYQETIG